jgi:TP901 family phage tail tape measure protein/lambda family phage tail tape measure protein
MAIGPQTLLFTLRVQDEASRALQGAGLAWASLGFAVGAATAAAVKANVEFSRTLTQMQTLAGVSSNEIAGVTEELKKMAIETGRGPQDLAKAMYFVSSSGFKTQEAMAVVKASAQGAAIGLGDTKTVADAVTSAMNAYGHANLGAAEAVGTMVAAVRDGKGEADQIASALGRVIGVSAQMGVSFQDVAGAVAAMTTTGLTAAQSVTAIRQTLLAVYAPTQQARRVLKELGVDYHDLQNVFREKGFLEGIENLKKVAGTAVNLRMIVGDKEAVNAIFGLLNQNLEHTKEIMADVRKSGPDTLRQAFAIAAQSSAFSWDQGMALIKVLMLDFGNAIMPIVIRAIHLAIEAFFVLRGLIDSVTAAWRNHRTALIAVGAALTTLLVMRTLPGLLINIAATVATTTVRLVAMTAAVEGFSIGSVVSSFGRLATSFALVGRAAAAAIPAVVEFTLALLTNPVFLLIAALALGSIALYKFATSMHDTSEGAVTGWQEIQAAWAGAGPFFGSIASDIDTALAPANATFNKFGQDAWDIISKAWDDVLDYTREHWDEIVAAVETALNNIVLSIPILGQIIGLIENYWGSVKEGAIAAWAAIKATVHSAIMDILGMVPGVNLAIGLAGAAAGAAATVAASGQRAAEAGGNAMHDSLVRSSTLNKINRGQIDFMGIARASAPKVKPPVLNPDNPNGVADYSPQRGGHQRAAGESPEEKEAKAVQKVVEALKVQTAAYKETAEQHEYLDAIRRAGLNSLTIEQNTLDKGLAITDKQAASNAHLNNIREIARGVQEKLTAEHDKWIEGLGIDNAATVKLIAAHELGVRQAYVETAVINAQSEALKAHKKFTDEDAQAVRAHAGAQFDQTQAMKSTDDARAWQDNINGLLDQAKAYDMTNRQRAIFLSGEAERRKSIAATGVADEAAISRAQNLAALQYDVEHHQMTALEGVHKFMDDMRENAITTGSIVYNALNQVFTGLTSALWNFVSGQKVGWRQMAFDVISSIGKMITQMLVMKAVMASLKFLGFATGGVVGGGGGGTRGASAFGNVFGTVNTFAKGQSFANTVVDTLTAFMYNEDGRKKLGIMGEAGPEAILPLMRTGQAMAVAAYARDGTKKALSLTRGPDGALGVRWPERFANGGVFGDRYPSRMGASGGGGAVVDAGTYINLGGISIHYEPTGDQRYDTQHLAQLKKIVTGAIDERIGVAARQMNKRGGRQSMFGLKAQG